MRKSIKLVIGLAALFTLIFASGVAFAANEIHWTIIGQTSVTFDWRGADSSVGEQTIQWGTSPGSYPFSALGATPNPLPFSSAGPFWEARLTGLTENTLYYYKIGANSEKTFRTPIPRGTSNFTVMAEADIGDVLYYANVGPVQGQIASDLPAFILIPGDLTYGNNHGQDNVENHFNDMMVWSQEAAYMPAWGNHEWNNTIDDLRNYKGRFDFLNPQTSPPVSENTCSATPQSCVGEDWYWFDYGNVRFIAYPEPFSGSWSDWNSKARVLMDSAQADPAITFIVTFGHRPAYSSGHHPGSSTLKGYLDALGAGHSKYVLNLNGHSHNYERTLPQSGVTHITVGTGGATLEQDSGGSACGNIWLACPAPSYTAARYMRHGVTKLTFSPAGISGQFLCGPAGGGTNDISCTVGDVIDDFTIGTPGGNQAPNGTIDTPVGPTTITVGQSVDFTGTGSDPDGNLPLTYAWNFNGGAANSTLEDPGSVAFNTAGTYNVTFTVTDSLGLPDFSPDSRVITVVVPDPTPPTVSITSPADGATVSGSVTVSATAADNVGVVGVQFRLDGANLGTEDTTSPHSISWNTAASSNGSHTLTALARDAAGNSTLSMGVGVTVDNDTIAPTVSITSPADSATVSGSISVSATASDNVGVFGVQFKLDGANLGSEVTSSPYTYTWNTAASSNGSHTLTAVARDAAGNSTVSSPINVIVVGGSDVTTFETRVAGGSDDAEESSSGSVSLSSSDLELIYDTSNQVVGIRFNGALIPQGATIANAYVQFKVDEAETTATALNIRGQASDNALVFTTTSGNISSRSKTAASIAWSPSGWTVIGEAGINQRTPDISALIQEIVNRPGWSSGNSLAVIIDGTGKRVAEAYEGDPGGAPLLHVEYAVPDTIPPARSGGQPTGILPAGTGTTSLTLVTDENATCRYSTTAGTAYASMVNTFTTTGFLAHSQTIPVADGTSYAYYVRCMDAALNANPDDYDEISFSVETGSAKFVVGNRVRTTQVLNVRNTPSLLGNILGEQPEEMFGTIIGGPISADGYWWWNVDYDNAPDGWSTEDFLESLAPSVPQGLVAVPVSSGVSLSWSASTDDVGVSNYVIYRNGSFIASTPATSYGDTGLVAGTSYSYAVAAIDEDDNISARSVSVSATTYPSSGSIKVKRVGSDDSMATAPANTAASFDGKRIAQFVNPAEFTSVAVGAHAVSATDVSGYTETAGTCVYPISGTECSIPSFSITPTCNGASCNVPVAVSQNMVTKVVVKYQNTPPIVNAGGDKSTAPDVPVVLAGSASDPGGTIVSYGWSVAPSGCVLSGETTATLTATCPTGTYTATLTATDNFGATASDGAVITVAVSSSLFSDNFEDGVADGWTLAGSLSASWSVAPDSTYVYKQTNNNASATPNAGDTWSYKAAAWTNYTVEARMKLDSFSGSNRFMGLYGRWLDNTHYYYAALRTSGTLELKKRVDSTITPLVTAISFTVTPGTWYRVKLSLDGNNIAVYVNDVLKLSATDSAIASGGVGVGGYYVAASFDDIVVDPIGAAALSVDNEDASMPSVSTKVPPLNDGGNSGLYEVGTNLSIIPDSAVFCPSGMMWVPLSGGFCIDRYESNNAGTAGSLFGKLPRGDVPFSEAESACKAVGKRLPTSNEWLIAAFGTPEDACVVGGSGPVSPGLRLGCKSLFGVYNMIGNVAEWTSDKKARGGSWADGAAAKRSSEVSEAVANDLIKTNGRNRDTIGFRCVK